MDSAARLFVAAIVATSALLVVPLHLSAQSPFLYSWGPRDGLVQSNVPQAERVRLEG